MSGEQSPAEFRAIISEVFANRASILADVCDALRDEGAKSYPRLRKAIVAVVGNVQARMQLEQRYQPPKATP